MQIFKCYVPRQDYKPAKELIAKIKEIERKKYPDLTDIQFDKAIAKKLRNAYFMNEGVLSLLDLLKEYYIAIKEEDI